MKEWSAPDITIKTDTTDFDTTEETGISARTFASTFYGDSYVELEEAALAAAAVVFPDLQLAVDKNYRVGTALDMKFSNPDGKKFMADITIYVVDDVEPEEEMRSLQARFYGDNDVEIENAAWNAAAEVFPGCLLQVVRDYRVANGSASALANPEEKKWVATVTVNVIQNEEPIAE